ncbi:MAG: hypothetical protein KatS3mg105_4609 [Gemmatales bacterium]|nr:MAG: hypothetical protein KatS3mg105_4609 [Gemmatales bacterium]
MISNRLPDVPRSVALTGVLLSIPVVGYFDYWSGEQLSFSIFYLPLVVLATVKGSVGWGTLTAILCALVWGAVNSGVFHHWGVNMIAVWNLLVRLGYFLLAVFFVSRLLAYAAREKERSRIDYLTGLATPRALAEFAEVELARGQRFGGQLTIVVFDCDNFKAVNDSCGHLEGDRVLRTIGEIVQANLRKTDFAARLGGDEFAIVLPQTSSDDSRAMMARLRNAILSRMERERWPITISAGVVTFTTPPKSLAAMLHEADKLMYSVKNNGKNSVMYASCQPETTEFSTTRKEAR